MTLNQLARKVKQVEPYVLQLSQDADSELIELAKFASEFDSAILVLAKQKGVLQNAHYKRMRTEEYLHNKDKWVVSRVHLSDPLCLILEDAGMNPA